MKENVLNWIDVLDSFFFIGHPKISLKPNDYKIIGESSSSLSSDRKRKLMFKDNFIDYAFLLRAPKKNKILDVALIGFKLEDKLIDCKQIQGCKGRYRELTPVVWYRSLLNSLKNFGYEYNFKEIQLPSFFDVEGFDVNNADAFKKKYDHNAESLDFRYSDNLKKWIYEF